MGWPSPSRKCLELLNPSPQGFSEGLRKKIKPYRERTSFVVHWESMKRITEEVIGEREGGPGWGTGHGGYPSGGYLFGKKKIGGGKYMSNIIQRMGDEKPAKNPQGANHYAQDKEQAIQKSEWKRDDNELSGFRGREGTHS